LDPINTQLVKDVMVELRDAGTTILMSTHQMHQVEELCDRIVLIDEGRNVLYGNLNQIRREYSGHAVLVRSQSDLPELIGVEEIQSHNSATRLLLSEETKPNEILNQLVSQNVILEKFEIAMPTLDEIFIKVVEEGDDR
jgi:ABC-2 type transport system ATP-binding protein